MLASSTPTDGAELDAAPRALSLAFRHAARLRSLSIRDAEGVAIRVVWNDERRTSTPQIPLPTLGSGSYWVAFTATADDGAAMRGVVHFTSR